jgi:hypothetical protein
VTCGKWNQHDQCQREDDDQDDQAMGRNTIDISIGGVMMGLDLPLMYKGQTRN